MVATLAFWIGHEPTTPDAAGRRHYRRRAVVLGPGYRPVMSANLFVLVGGWPGAGKSTLAGILATELGLPLLAKDEIKVALMDAMGTPTSVEESRRLGRAAVHATLRAAMTCPGAVIDSTWFAYTAELVRRLPGRLVEVRCLVALDVARSRFRERIRDERHLDAQRTDAELWGTPVAPLGVGPLVDVDTSCLVDIEALVAQIRRVRAA